jgi:hypothetical protein
VPSRVTPVACVLPSRDTRACYPEAAMLDMYHVSQQHTLCNNTMIQWR